jgi:hypothetical protein
MGDCIWIHYARPRPHWYALDAAAQAARREAWRDLEEASRARGGTPLGTYHVRGQHDFETVTIWRFPDAEAAFAHWAGLTGAQYGEFNAFSNAVGLASEAPP